MPTTQARPLHALLAGGGTGGHVFPALAVAEELLGRGWRVSYAGMADGLEARLVPPRGLPFHPLPARPVVGRGLVGKVGALGTLGAGALAARSLVRRLGVDVVLGTGGYVSVPAVLGARLAGRPVVLLEPNARAGVANRWLSRWAAGAAVAYRQTIADLRCPGWVTGVPVRSAFFEVPSEPPAGPPRLLVLGGSQGARQVNQAMVEALPRLAERLPELSVVHQVGAKNLDETREAYARAGAFGAFPGLELVPFIDDVAGAMAASHLVLSRAGAITVAEICAAGRPALYVPLAIAQAHQVENARLVAGEGGAELLLSTELTGGRLAALLAELLSGRERLAHMGRAARRLARPDAVAAIAGRLEEVGGRA